MVLYFISIPIHLNAQPFFILSYYETSTLSIHSVNEVTKCKNLHGACTEKSIDLQRERERAYHICRMSRPKSLDEKVSTQAAALHLKCDNIKTL